MSDAPPPSPARVEPAHARDPHHRHHRHYPHDSHDAHDAHDSHDAHDAPSVKCAVVTVSDTRTIADDASGAAIVELLREGGLDPSLRLLVRDDRDAIQAAILDALAHGARLVVSTGGTGIAPRDVTIEVVEGLLEKRLDGFGEAFRRLSWEQIGARAILSRAVAGTRNDAMICALPGSERAVRLAMKELILPIARHAIGLLDP
jgi:molybdenum cofactor biosynthesis protein B